MKYSQERMHPPRYSVGMLAKNAKDCYPGLTFDGAGQCPPAELLSNVGDGYFRRRVGPAFLRL